MMNQKGTRIRNEYQNRNKDIKKYEDRDVKFKWKK